jgi:murein L,D-transpeptidase YcbB/YkuD
MYEGDRPVDSMKVVVGKTEMPTPIMAGMIRTAIVNPYWQVPDDLVQTNIAANVLEKGVKYLRTGGYQVLASWDEGAKPVDPKKVDWQAVHAGRAQVHVRQLPGGANFMGKVKFEFPNPMGIYLHDTPAKDLMAQDTRTFSSGCVRLEDAQRLGRWLFGGTLPTSKQPETKVALPQAVPVYITYLTAYPEAGGQVAFRSDPYKRDTTQLALADTGSAAASR